MLEYGVDKADIFQTNDLFERKDLGAVTNTIFALDRAVKVSRRNRNRTFRLDRAAKSRQTHKLSKKKQTNNWIKNVFPGWTPP